MAIDDKFQQLELPFMEDIRGVERRKAQARGFRYGLITSGLTLGMALALGATFVEVLYGIDKTLGHIPGYDLAKESRERINRLPIPY